MAVDWLYMTGGTSNNSLSSCVFINVGKYSLIGKQGSPCGVWRLFL